MPLEWYGKEHDFEERNNFIHSTCCRFRCTSRTIMPYKEKACLMRPIEPSMIDAIFFISSSGISTPSIEARIMNLLPFRDNTKRVPIWGLGCAGGAAGISRAYEYCLAFPEANVLVLSVNYAV